MVDRLTSFSWETANNQEVSVAEYFGALIRALLGVVALEAGGREFVPDTFWFRNTPMERISLVRKDTDSGDDV